MSTDNLHKHTHIILNTSLYCKYELQIYHGVQRKQFMYNNLSNDSLLSIIDLIDISKLFFLEKCPYKGLQYESIIEYLWEIFRDKSRSDEEWTFDSIVLIIIWLLNHHDKSKFASCISFGPLIDFKVL